MKVSALFFQSAALVGAMLLSKTEGLSLPLPDLSDVEPVYQLPEVFGPAMKDALKAVIDSNDYECERSPLGSYYRGLLEGVESDTLDALAELSEYYAFGEWTALATLLFNDDDTDDVFGNSTQQTIELKKRFRKMKKFWDVESDMEDVLLKSFNGQALKDTELMVVTLQAVFYIPEIYASELVAYAQSVIESDAALDYDSPIWSLNAFAFSYPPLGLPDQIAIGDGLLEFFKDVDTDDAGPDFVLAHEFAHLLQLNRHIDVNFEGTPESTRYTELMADAISAYYLAHVRGATFQNKRIEELTVAASEVGDCSFSSNGHHGTPNQRKAAAGYGAKVAAENNSAILSPAEFAAEFNAEYSTLIAPDAN